MLRELFKLTLFCLLAFSNTLTSLKEASAQSNKPEPLQGSINLDLEETEQDPYGVTQAKVMDFFKTVNEQIASLASVGSGHIPEIDDNALQFFGAAYLYCSVKNGVCPMMLNALLETDLINSKLRGNSDCPNMSRFWKLWLKNEMEQRQGYLVKVAHVGITADFKRNERPKYIKCGETIEKQIQSGPQPILEFFKERYGVDSQPVKDLQTAQEFLKLMAEKVQDVYVSLGIKFDSGKKEGAPEGKTKKSKGSKGSAGGSGAAKKSTAKKKSIR